MSVRVTVLIVFLTLLQTSVKAQITRSNWMVGGNISYVNRNTTYASIQSHHKDSRFDLNPKAGYFFIDKLATGLTLNYGRLKDTYESNTVKYWNIGIGPFVRYYFLGPDHFINILAEGSVALVRSKANNDQDVLRGTSYSLFAGPVLFVNSSVGIEFLAGYVGDKFQDGGQENNGFKCSIGVQVHLERDK
ncbi:hypothetical protein [Flavihumibacter petaseus]|uniref:Outer membrane protein beta-barrel domain-containing protein n=1 Tax=Flavihumibacter petaseus NBRC 106054 TaxID=1220578 RepID=A0A0E9MX25_9BACT|nr:hypothetical protein [Flavihumibacter petaseus]GAO42297.1 hypothetical protein FPE01S_01_13100 [Flavihumibacter petaseus NBRC 106054]